MPLWVEWLLVALLVAGSSVYALWRLLPTTWRLRWQVRFGWRVAADACGCDGCPPAKASTANSGDLPR
ncbi:MAG: hypothetical protein RJB26_1704 [Pseudomonadota bacterium]|jgi:hypothetical protein